LCTSGLEPHARAAFSSYYLIKAIFYPTFSVSISCFKFSAQILGEIAKMGLGVLEDLKLDHVPGTVLLDQNAGRSEDITGGLKHGTGKDANIVLAPNHLKILMTP
jgi:hypothetical protein